MLGLVFPTILRLNLCDLFSIFLINSHLFSSPIFSLSIRFPLFFLPFALLNMCGILAVLGCSDDSQAKRVRVLELSRRQVFLIYKTTNDFLKLHFCFYFLFLFYIGAILLYFRSY